MSHNVLVSIRTELDYIYNIYKVRYKMLTMQVDILNTAIVINSKWYIKKDAERTINETKQLDGYVECLFDLGFFSEDDFNKLWTFTQLIRLECKDLLLEVGV